MTTSVKSLQKWKFIVDLHLLQHLFLNEIYSKCVHWSWVEKTCTLLKTSVVQLISSLIKYSTHHCITLLKNLKKVWVVQKWCDDEQILKVNPDEWCFHQSQWAFYLWNLYLLWSTHTLKNLKAKSDEDFVHWKSFISNLTMFCKLMQFIKWVLEFLYKSTQSSEVLDVFHQSSHWWRK